jgi:hypothetical protein
MTEPLTEKSLAMCLRELAYVMNITPESRHRMAGEIAKELLAEHGATAHLYCLEKLANNANAPRLWRDVLSYLDEIGVTDGTVGTNRNGRGQESTHHSDNDS